MSEPLQGFSAADVIGLGGMVGQAKNTGAYGPGIAAPGFDNSAYLKGLAKERRERIATAVLAGFCVPIYDPERKSISSAAGPEAVKEAVSRADALIAELDR